MLQKTFHKGPRRHLALTAPSVWMLMHMRTPSGIMMGASLPFAPGVVIGRSEHFAWGVTNTGVDVQDLYDAQAVEFTAASWGIRRCHDPQEPRSVKGSEHGS